jgi:uncharacterized radical SAM superfamily protein
MAVRFDILTDGHAILKAETDTLEDWMKEAMHVRLQNFGTELLCYSPTAYPYKIRNHEQTNIQSFPSLSVTGTSCSLMCEHCDGRLLRGMDPALTPEQLFERCREVDEAGGKGVLISGGSDSEGHVPLARFGEAIKRVKRELDLLVVVHTGLVTPQTAQVLAEAQIDAAMLDVIGDTDVASRVYHIPDGPRKMRNSLDILEEQNIPTVPHVLVGLDSGKIHGEIEALQLIAQGTPSAVVIIALSPLRRTPMEHVTPPSPDDVGRIMTTTRLGFSTIPVLLGCARPLGQHKIDTDLLAVKSGMNGVALISQEGVDFARQLGLMPVFEDVCCSLAYKGLS